MLFLSNKVNNINLIQTIGYMTFWRLDNLPPKNFQYRDVLTPVQLSSRTVVLISYFQTSKQFFPIVIVTCKSFDSICHWVIASACLGIHTLFSLSMFIGTAQVQAKAKECITRHNSIWQIAINARKTYTREPIIITLSEVT